MKEPEVAVRKEELYAAADAVVLEFPVRIARARAARARRARAERSLAAWLTALVVTSGLLVTAISSRPEAPQSRPGAPHAVVVEAGQTLADVGKRYAAEGTDPHAYADAVASLNQVQGVVPPGRELELP